MKDDFVKHILGEIPVLPLSHGAPELIQFISASHLGPTINSERGKTLPVSLGNLLTKVLFSVLQRLNTPKNSLVSGDCSKNCSGAK